MYFIGTSGFQYPEWKGGFYPEKMAASKMLAFYSEQFPTTEINYSFRKIPSAKSIRTWLESTPDLFRFSLKAPQKITHIARLRDCTENLNYFLNAVSGLGKKLGPVFFQLPPNFKKDAALLKQFLGTVAPGMRIAFEFRHPSWFDDEVYDCLREKNCALCIAESDELTAPFVLTADFAFLRLRREDYTEPDLVRWAKVIGDQPKSETFIYFKHEEKGVGPRFAKQMTKIFTNPSQPGSLTNL